MNNRTKARERRIPQAFQKQTIYSGEDLTTAVNPVKSCGHSRASVRNVTAPDGAAGYVCRDCFAHLRAVEVRVVEVDRIRLELARLFRRLRPWVFGLRGAILALANRLTNYLLTRALLAAYRDRSHKPYISLARIAARIAEKGGRA